MASKVLIILTQTLLIKNIMCQCIARYTPITSPCVADTLTYANSFANPMTDTFAYNMATPLENWSYSPCSFASETGNAFDYGVSYGVSSASYGGALPVSSVSPMASSGLSVLSENAIEGPLAVMGQLPFLGSVALEGALPTVGAGTVSYGSGNGNVAILSEGQSYGYPNMGYNYGYEVARRPNCGCW